MASVLIQGGSRGLGLQFAKVLVSRPEVSKVVITSRRAQTEPSLLSLKKDFVQKVSLINLDVTNEANIKERIADISDKSQGKLDLLVNCSAILHPSGRGETSLRDVSGEGLLATFQTNAIGPLLVGKYLAPLLLKGNGLIGSQAHKSHSAVMVNMTAKVSSITENNLGGWYSYRMSKTALNMANKTLSIELGRGKAKVICVALHPGTVDTDLSRPYHRGVPPEKLFSVNKSVDYLMKIIDSLSSSDSGKFLAWDGNVIPY